MVFAFLYSWLRLFFDLVDLRLGPRDAEAEILLLRHQLRVVRRQVKKPRLEPADRAIMAALSRLVSRAALAGMLVQPETVLGRHRELVRRKWAAFGQLRGPGRPPLSDEVIALISADGEREPKVGLCPHTWGASQSGPSSFDHGHQESAPKASGSGIAGAVGVELEGVSQSAGVGDRG